MEEAEAMGETELAEEAGKDILSGRVQCMMGAWRMCQQEDQEFEHFRGGSTLVDIKVGLAFTHSEKDQILCKGLILKNVTETQGWVCF